MRVATGRVDGRAVLIHRVEDEDCFEGRALWSSCDEKGRRLLDPRGAGDQVRHRVGSARYGKLNNSVFFCSLVFLES